MAMSEKAIKAGVTEEEGQFVASMWPKILIGMVLEIPLVENDELRRMLGVLDKLVAVDPNTIPPNMQPAIERLRARVLVH